MAHKVDKHRRLWVLTFTDWTDSEYVLYTWSARMMTCAEEFNSQESYIELKIPWESNLRKVP